MTTTYCSINRILFIEVLELWLLLKFWENGAFFPALKLSSYRHHHHHHNHHHIANTAIAVILIKKWPPTCANSQQHTWAHRVENYNQDIGMPVPWSGRKEFLLFFLSRCNITASITFWSKIGSRWWTQRPEWCSREPELCSQGSEWWLRRPEWYSPPTLSRLNFLEALKTNRQSVRPWTNRCGSVMNYYSWWWWCCWWLDDVIGDNQKTIMITIAPVPEHQLKWLNVPGSN